MRKRSLKVWLVWTIVLTIVMLGQASSPQSVVLPGGRPQDAALAIQNPHEYAWQLFLATNVQAANGLAGVPDSTKNIKTYDADKPVVWETWALASGGRASGRRTIPNRSEVYLDKGAQPRDWSNLPRTVLQEKKLQPFSSERLEFLSQKAEIQEPQPNPLKIFQPNLKKTFQIMLDPSLPERAEELFEGGQPTGYEVRMNKSTFEFIRNNKLYSIEGLESAFQKGERIVFPNEAQEIKAQWVKITEAEKNRYHWRGIKNEKGIVEIWGLSGFHIITRDLPNWFWCDFEHIDFLPMAEAPPDDPTTRGQQAPARGSSDGIRKETEGSKWQYYRLRGIQVDFTDSRGFPTVLANSQIEKGFQQTSSCITCHSRATVGLRRSDSTANPFRTYSLPVFEEVFPILLGSVGQPNRRWFTDDRGRPKFLQTDFLWSMPFRACSENETPPTP